MLKWISRKVEALHTDEQGADMVEYVLIVAAVALPLLAVIIWFWKDISIWLNEAWVKIRGGGGDTDPGDIQH
jgi:Flp pilus assembly pilin Flp